VSLADLVERQKQKTTGLTLVLEDQRPLTRARAGRDKAAVAA
jgi:hypothetical protein